MTFSRFPQLVLAGTILAALVTPSLNAQEADAARSGPLDEVVIDTNTGAGTSGRLAVNIASGTNNQQIGDAIIALGGIAVVTETLGQHINGSAPQDRSTSIIIGDGAFAGTTGLASINITAGAQNQMANLTAIAVGNSGVMTDQLLEQSRASIQPNGGIQEGPLPSNDTVAIGDSAFGDGSGLIQVNLIGGEGNSSANTFALNVPGEGSP